MNELLNNLKARTSFFTKPKKVKQEAGVDETQKKLYEMQVAIHKLQAQLQVERCEFHARRIEEQQRYLELSTQLNDALVNHVKLLSLLAQLTARLELIESVQQGMLASKKGVRL